jgi:SAM-dependent methyltransferase
VRAAQSPEWRLRGFSEAANAFYRAGHQAAALSCFRRAREPLLTNDDLRIIYTLARSFEDLGHLEIARDHLDIIMVQNPDYRDVASRLQGYQRFPQGLTGERQRIDYTGVTVNLLGPDVPSMDVDPKLRNVIEARTAELGVTKSGKDEYKAIIEQLYQQGILRAAEPAEIVEYNRNSYIKYDFLLPEDDVKKRLEAVNVIAISRKVKNLSRSLDIGTATGRYPGIFVSLGWDAHGVDYEEEAIEYAKSKIVSGPGPKFSVGDARSLSFSQDYFDFVTCMMGTFFHIPLVDQLKAVEEMARVCRPGGIVAISTWDIECPHLTYLSMYSVNEKELITRNARTLSAMLALLTDAGLKNVTAVRFSLVPDTISYDLGIEKLSVDGVKRLLEIDIATRRAMPGKHGQMFIVYGEK